MVQLRTTIVVLCLSLLFGALAVTSDAAGRKICLSVDKNGVNNSGSDSIKFDWSIQSDTTCSSIKFEITGPGTVATPSYTCANGTAGPFTWTVPAGQAPGLYTAKLTYKSNWSGDTYCCATAFEDTAQVQFSVCRAGRVVFCKYHDQNGNGIRDTGEPALSGWTFKIKKGAGGTVVGSGTTGATGCTSEIIVPMDPCSATCTTYYVEEIAPNGDTGWCRTKPSPGSTSSEFTIQVCSTSLNQIEVLNSKPCFKVYKFQDTNGNSVLDNGEPGLANWQFQIERPLGNVIGTYTTNSNGYTDLICVTPDPGNTTTTVYVREITKPGWVQTTPATNPKQVNLKCGANQDEVFGNWQPITITGNKFLDNNPVVWACNPIFGDGPTNPPGIPNWPVMLYEDNNGNGVIDPGDSKLADALTNQNGKYQFTNQQWREHFIIKEGTHPATPPECDPTLIPCDPAICAAHNNNTWVDQTVSTVAISPYIGATGGEDCLTPDDLAMNLVNAQPTTTNQEYPNNDFYNRCPSRLWGQVCPDLLKPGVNFQLTVKKNGQPDQVITPCPDCGYYIISCTPEEPEGLRCGTFTLIPSGNIGSDCDFTATQYCGDAVSGQKTTIPVGGSTDVVLDTCEDVRVDFCVDCEPNRRRCGLPVTFTPEGWSEFCDPTNPIINGGMVYSKFPKAFNNYTLCGKLYTNQLVVGGANTITFIGKTASLQRLCMLLGGECSGCGVIKTTLESPWRLELNQGGGCLAVETIALVMNVAYNDKRLMPRTAGVDIENYIVKKGVLKGKTVDQVLTIANAVLAGAPPSKYGLQDCGQLVDVIRNINANYEFTDFNTFTDKDYLTPVPALSETPMFPKDPHDFVLSCIK